jgi:hypothetical protein
MESEILAEKSLVKSQSNANALEESKSSAQIAEIEDNRANLYDDLITPADTKKAPVPSRGKGSRNLLRDDVEEMNAASETQEPEAIKTSWMTEKGEVLKKDLEKTKDTTLKMVKFTENVGKVMEPEEGAEKVKDGALEVGSNLSWLKSLAGFAAPVVRLITSVIEAKAKWTQWTAFSKAAEVDKKIPGKKPLEEAIYGLTKVGKGFFRKLKDGFMSVVEIVQKALLIIPGAQIVGATMAAVHSFIGVCEKLYGGFKTFYQKLFGEKKVGNSESLLDKALKNDTAALQLILELELSSIAGSDIKLFDYISSVGNAAKNMVKGAVGMNKTESGAQRIIDLYGLGSGGPKDIKKLHELLLQVNANPDSRKLILSEIKESMTGYGT